MTYQPSDGAVDIVNSECFSSLYQLAIVTEEQGAEVKAIAEREPPPQAPNRLAATENCQGWAVRVVGKLVEKGIAQASKIEMMRSMLEPV